MLLADRSKDVYLFHAKGLHDTCRVPTKGVAVSASVIWPYFPRVGEWGPPYKGLFTLCQRPRKSITYVQGVIEAVVVTLPGWGCRIKVLNTGCVRR